MHSRHPLLVDRLEEDRATDIGNMHMIAEFANEYSSLLTTDYFNAEIRNLQQMIKRRKESDRGDWPENLLQLQCYVHACMPLQDWTS